MVGQGRCRIGRTYCDALLPAQRRTGQPGQRARPTGRCVVSSVYALLSYASVTTMGQAFVVAPDRGRAS